MLSIVPELRPYFGAERKEGALQCPLNLGRAAATEPGGSVAVENPQCGGGPPVRDVIPSLSFRIDSLAPEVNKHLLRQLTGVEDSEQQKVTDLLLR